MRRLEKMLRDHPLEGGPADIAAEIFPKLRKADLFPLLVDRIEQEQRKNPRVVETRFVSDFLATQAPENRTRFVSDFLATQAPAVKAAATLVKTADSKLARFGELLAQRISLGDGSATTWGECTLEQHKQRLEMLLVQRAGLNQTISMHEHAIELISDGGVSCLNELL